MLCRTGFRIVTSVRVDSGEIESRWLLKTHLANLTEHSRVLHKAPAKRHHLEGRYTGSAPILESKIANVLATKIDADLSSHQSASIAPHCQSALGCGSSFDLRHEHLRAQGFDTLI
jgi:hypothetical protein